MSRGVLNNKHVHRVLRFVLLAAVTAGGVFVAWALFATVPSIETIENRSVAESTKIYDRTGNVLLYDVHGAVRRTEVPFDEISPHIRNASVAIEDDTFYQHKGFRPLAFLRAILVNLHLMSGYRGQGGSTITQQVIKNTLLTQDKTIIRKAKEIVLALKLERIASKDEILNIYLNETAYGGTVYGVEEASQYFFGKAAKDVSLAEAAYIAALPQAPTRLSPYRTDPQTGRNEQLEERQDLVLSRMRDLNYISQEEYDAASLEQVQFSQRAETGIKAPHFVFFVREYLEDKYGADEIANGGLRVITTLDWDLQLQAEEIVRERALTNEKQFNAENAGLVAIDPTNGQILTMVGSRGFLDPDIDGQVNVTIMPRQPGSAFKPFVYATAFERGYTPETILFDVQTQFSTTCSPADTANREDPCYSPDNYDHLFRGPMTIRNALAQSVNVPAVKALYLAGISESLATAADMGISTLSDAARYGLTLVLGGGEVTLLEMTSAYSVFANEGLRNPPVGVLRIEDSRGRVLEEYEQHEARALDSQVAAQITDILSDNAARTPLYGANSPLHFSDHDVAAKTGTTNENRDAWVIGYSTSIVVGAWAGNNIPEPMNQISGLIVTPMWREFMDVALTKYPSDEFPPPAPDPSWGSLSPILRGEWNVSPVQGIHSILYWINKDNPRSGGPNWNDSQLPHWEHAVAQWVNATFYGINTNPNATPGFAIASPNPNARLPLRPFETFVEYETTLDVHTVSYYLNGELVGTAQEPFALTITPPGTGSFTLKAIADTTQGTQAESEISIIIE